MGKTNSAKKHAKQLRRRDRMAAKQQRLQALARKNVYPRFSLVPNDSPPEFVRAVESAVREIDFENRDILQEWERATYRRIREVGHRRALWELEQAASRAGPLGPVATAHFATNLGHQVLVRIPPEIQSRFLPYHDFLIQPSRQCLQVYFRSLRQAKGPAGTVYYSRHEPKLQVNGRRLTVAFSGHAIQRVCERLSYEWPSYAGLGDLFALFDQCLDYELCELHGGQLAFTFFDECVPDFSSYGIAEEVSGPEFVPGATYNFRVGYCPAVVEGDFIKAKTLLFPGYGTTPEYGKIREANLSPEEKRKMIEEAKGLNAKRLLEPGGLDLVKWFHQQGVPQVRRGEVRYAPAVP